MKSQPEQSLHAFTAGAEKLAQDMPAQIEALRQELQTMSNQMMKYLQTEKRQFAGAAGKAVENATAVLESSAGDLAEGMKEKASDLHKALIAEVRTNPLRAVAVTIGIGIFLGAMSRSK